MKQNIKLIGQLIEDEKPVTLVTTKSLIKISRTVSEYISVFPDIFLTAEWGYFKPQISSKKKKAISNLLYILNSPINNLISQF